MLEPALAEAYDRSRPLSTKPFRAVCYAPSNSMYLDTYGLVRACCVNRRYVLGDLREQRLDEIWFGKRAKALRDAMNRYELRLGCEFCDWQIRNGNFTDPRTHQASVHARKYDMFGVKTDSDQKLWPTNLEFNLSNTCNLECVTCNGEFSSSIRARQEKLPPIPRAYSDQFFDDLRKYIPHVRTAQFLGGEPFLIKDHYRVWEMMAEQGPNAMDWVGVTTNGTIYNDKVQHILDTLPISIVMSMDGVTKATFEAVRVNAIYEEFMVNFHRFLAYHRAHKRRLGFNFTLSRLNAHEFAEFLLFAESFDCEVNVCTLVSPDHFSLYTLEPAELKRVIDELGRRDDELQRTLKINQVAWSSALANLHHQLERTHQALPVVKEALEVDLPDLEPELAAAHAPRFIDEFLLTEKRTPEEQAASHESARASLTRWSGMAVDWLQTDTGDFIKEVHASGDSFLGLGVDLTGHSLQELHGVLRERLGADLEFTDLEIATTVTDRIITLGDGEHRRACLRVIMLPRFDPQGGLAGLSVMIARKDSELAVLQKSS